MCHWTDWANKTDPVQWLHCLALYAAISARDKDADCMLFKIIVIDNKEPNLIFPNRLHFTEMKSNAIYVIRYFKPLCPLHQLLHWLHKETVI